MGLFSPAMKPSGKNPEGAGESGTEWHRCLAFRKLSEIAASLKKESQGGHGGWNVPKRDLIADLQVPMEQDELHVARQLPEAGALVKELMDVRVTGRYRVGRTGTDRMTIW